MDLIYALYQIRFKKKLCVVLPLVLAQSPPNYKNFLGRIWLLTVHLYVIFQARFWQLQRPYLKAVLSTSDLLHSQCTAVSEGSSIQGLRTLQSLSFPVICISRSLPKPWALGLLLVPPLIPPTPSLLLQDGEERENMKTFFPTLTQYPTFLLLTPSPPFDPLGP